MEKHIAELKIRLDRLDEKLRLTHSRKRLICISIINYSNENVPN